MKVLFYDISDFELEHFLRNSLSSIEPYFFKIPLNNRTFIDEKYKDAKAISVFVNSDLSEEVLSAFKNLKFIFLRCTGYSNVDLKYCKAKGIKVFNVPDYGSESVAEYAFMLLLSMIRNIIKANLNLKNGYIDNESLTGIELFGKTLGVVGVGAIGKRVLDIASCFNMNTLAFDVVKGDKYNYVAFDELLKKSDFIVISCPLNNSTKHLINHSAISKMKNGVFLINVSRGEIVDTESLYNAVVNKKISSAALDVVECEQMLCKIHNKCDKKEYAKSNCLKKYLFATKLMQMENIIITPHIAYNTIEAKKKIIETTIENIKSSFNINYGTKNLVLI